MSSETDRTGTTDRAGDRVDHHPSVAPTGAGLDFQNPHLTEAVDKSFM